MIHSRSAARGGSSKKLWNTISSTKGVQFAWQHDITLYPDNTVSLFDNEAAPTVGPESDGQIVKIDLAHKIVSNVKEYRHNSPLKAGSQGNTQLLPNGNVLIGWGAAPSFSEYSKSGKLLLEGTFPGQVQSYRTTRSLWVGVPFSRPAVAAKPSSTGGTDIFVSWNGATEVKHWQVLAGSTKEGLTAVGTAQPRLRFETQIAVPSKGPYFKVQALGSNGEVLKSSKVELVGQ